MTEYFFDTYALVAAFEDVSAYKGYQDADIFTSTVNLLEFHYVLLRKQIVDADRIIESLFGSVTDITKEDVCNAGRLKFARKAQQLSYADCLGYVIAERLGIPFLTGDREFRDLENVEFAA